jgi:hypothetical protein
MVSIIGSLQPVPVADRGRGTAVMTHSITSHCIVAGVPVQPQKTPNPDIVCNPTYRLSWP